MSAPAVFQHIIDTYQSETEKVLSVWRAFTDDELSFRPDPKSSTVLDILRHELLSQRRFFAEFLGSPEPAAAEVLPKDQTVGAFAARLAEMAGPRAQYLARQDEPWWLERVKFFDVERERIWVVWRRMLHTAHHRAQLAGYLRAIGKPVPSVYGPTADVTWSGADPTRSVDAASRK